MAKNRRNKPVKKAKNKESQPIKEKLQYGDVTIPACVHTQTVRIYLIALGIFVMGLAFTFFAFDLFVTIGSVVVAFIVACIGFYREYRISHDGYMVIEGTCERVEYTMTSQTLSNISGGRTKDTPSRFIILTEDGPIAIPFFKQNPLLDEGDPVRLYVKENTKFYEVRGAYTPDSFLGYEMKLPEKTN